jgi:hypothetical protein
VADRVQQFHARLNRSSTILGAANALDEERHHFVTDELVDHRVVPQERARRSDVEPVEQRSEVCRDDRLGKPGSAHVGEQDRDVDLGSPWGNRVAAAAAQIGVLARGPSRNGENVAAEAAERVIAPLAARLRGQIAKHVPHFDQRSVTVGEQPGPLLRGDLFASPACAECGIVHVAPLLAAFA